MFLEPELIGGVAKHARARRSGRRALVLLGPASVAPKALKMGRIPRQKGETKERSNHTNREPEKPDNSSAEKSIARCKYLFDRSELFRQPDKRRSRPRREST